MGTRDPRVDAYIASAAAFAQPILGYLRDTVHEFCPDVQETIKWGFPHFLHHGILCSMAAFKQHCAFGFWKGSLFVADTRHDEAMGQFGRITSLDNAPNRQRIAGYLRQAMQFNVSGTKPARATKEAKPKPPAEIPDDLAAALETNRKAAVTFESFSNTNRREYIEWITEAKRAETRAKRLAQTIEWLADGKPRNWKYLNC